MKKELRLAQIIDLEYIQQLQDRISYAADVSVTILDFDGEPVTKLSNGRKLCKLAEAYDREICIKSRRQLCEQARDKRRPVSLTCPYTGMTGAGIPIFLGGYFLGALIIGQVRISGNKNDFLENNISNKLLKKVPELTNSEFDMIKEFISIVADELVKIALITLELREKNERLKNTSDELNQLAYYDRLLKLPNRERMEISLNNDPYYECIIVIRISDFDHLISRLDRAYADALLISIRDYILGLNITNSELYCGKLSHFNILFKNIRGNMKIPIDVAKKIMDRCKNIWEIGNEDAKKNILINANICVIPIDPNSYNTFDNIAVAAGHALELSSKAEDVLVYDENERKMLHAGIKLENTLKTSVYMDMKGFEVVYRPIINAVSARWSGLEALCRWNSHELGVVPSNVIMPIAKANGFSNTISCWLLEQAVAQVKKWNLDLLDNFFLYIGIPTVQLISGDIDKILAKILHKYNYPPHKLGLGVVEAELSEDFSDLIKRLNLLGVAIVPDDLGEGYSSSDMLYKLPLGMLKTDRTFISGTQRPRQLLKVMVSLAYGADMKSLAKDVHSDYDTEILLKQVADYFRDYFFSHPLSACEIKKNLKRFYNSHIHVSELGNDYQSEKLGLMLDYFMNALADESRIRESILNNMDIAVYISDLETNRVLFANNRMKRLYGEPIENMPCWQALRRKNKRCEFCPVLYLLKNPGKTYTWRFQDEMLDKRFKVHDSIILWSGGKLAHLQCAMESEY